MASVVDTHPANRRDSRVAMPDGEILLQRGGSGPPLVFLHGGGAGTWGRLQDLLASSFDVLAPVHPASSERFEEAHDLIIKAWTTDEPFQWVTRNYEYRYVSIWPRPLQQPHPPIVMAGGGTPETTRWAAKHRHLYMAVIAPTPSIKRWFDSYRRLAEEDGWAPGPDRFGWVTPCYVGETDRKAVEEAREPIEWYFNKSLRQPPGAGLPPGYISLEAMRASLASGQVRGGPRWGTTIEELIAGGFVVVGSPDTVSERIAELSETLGFEHLGVNLTVGSIAESQARENIEAFAKEVMPRFRSTADSTGSAVSTSTAVSTSREGNGS